MFLGKETGETSGTRTVALVALVTPVLLMQRALKEFIQRALKERAVRTELPPQLISRAGKPGTHGELHRTELPP